MIFKKYDIIIDILKNVGRFSAYISTLTLFSLKYHLYNNYPDGLLIVYAVLLFICSDNETIFPL